MNFKMYRCRFGHFWRENTNSNVSLNVGDLNARLLNLILISDHFLILLGPPFMVTLRES